MASPLCHSLVRSELNAVLRYKLQAASKIANSVQQMANSILWYKSATQPKLNTCLNVWLIKKVPAKTRTVA